MREFEVSEKFARAVSLGLDMSAICSYSTSSNGRVSQGDAI